VEDAKCSTHPSMSQKEKKSGSSERNGPQKPEKSLFMK
jgi:hypothetical protein